MTGRIMRVRRILRSIREAGRYEDETLHASDLCWACSLNKCGQGVFTNTCRCCRSNHL